MGRGTAGLISYELGTFAGMDSIGGRTLGTYLQVKLLEAAVVMRGLDPPGDLESVQPAWTISTTVCMASTAVAVFGYTSHRTSSKPRSPRERR